MTTVSPEQTTTTADQTTRDAIRAKWESILDAGTSVDMPASATVIKDDLIQDADFLTRFATEHLRGVVYEVGLSMLSARRAMTTLSAEQVLDQIEPLLRPSNLSRWLEYDPETKREIPLLALTKEQANRAAGLRRTRANTDLRRAGMLEHAAARLTEGQCIGDVWTISELEALEQTIAVAEPEITVCPASPDSILGKMRREYAGKDA